MARPIRIVTDSASDLSPAEAQELDIDLVPLSVTIGERSYLEHELSHDEYFTMVRNNVVRTSQPSVGAFYAVFQHWVEQGYQVLYIGLSSVLSGTYQSAAQAAERLQEFVTLVDSKGVSRVEAIQVKVAQTLVRQGADLAAVLAMLQSVQARTHMLVQLDTLERLRQGGRAAKIVHIFDRFARAFQIKPIMSLANGELVFAHVARTFRRGMEYMHKEFTAFGPAEYLHVVHTRIPELASEFARDLAARVGLEPAQVVVCEAGSVISSHGGEGLLGAVLVSAR